MNHSSIGLVFLLMVGFGGSSFQMRDDSGKPQCHLIFREKKLIYESDLIEYRDGKLALSGYYTCDIYRLLSSWSIHDIEQNAMEDGQVFSEVVLEC